MLVFVVPLRSPQTSQSWEQVSKLFERCVRSICNQTSSKFKIIVVCHEKPHIEFTHPYIKYVEVGFSLPENPKLRDKQQDKGRKIIMGAMIASEFNPSHLMFVDADDCVSKYLSEFVSQNSQKNGWFLNRGYIYQEGSRFINIKRNNFYKWCGTCNIIKYELQDLPESTTVNYQDFNSYSSSHAALKEKMSQNRTPIEALPFAGAVYIISHGENIEGSSKLVRPKEILPRIKNTILNCRYLTNSIRNEFGLYNIY